MGQVNVKLSYGDLLSLKNLAKRPLIRKSGFFGLLHGKIKSVFLIKSYE